VRENRTHGSEGGEARQLAFPTPITERRLGIHYRGASSPRHPWLVVVSDFEIRASDLCPATLLTSLVANATPTYCTYNAANELLQEVTPGGGTATYAYPPVGGRFARVSPLAHRKTDRTGTKWYVWDGLDILLEHDGTGTLLRRTTHGHTAIPGVGSLIAVEDAEQSGSSGSAGASPSPCLPRGPILKQSLGLLLPSRRATSRGIT